MNYTFLGIIKTSFYIKTRWNKFWFILCRYIEKWKL